jgi:hypothetical protein
VSGVLAKYYIFAGEECATQGMKYNKKLLSSRYEHAHIF